MNGREKFFAREAFGLDPDLECFPDGSVKVFRLLGYAIGDAHVGLRGIDKVEPEDIFAPCGAHVKAITIVRRVRQIMAVFVGNPLLVSPGDRDKGEQEKKQPLRKRAIQHPGHS